MLETSFFHAAYNVFHIITEKHDIFADRVRILAMQYLIFFFTSWGFIIFGNLLEQFPQNLDIDLFAVADATHPPLDDDALWFEEMGDPVNSFTGLDSGFILDWNVLPGLDFLLTPNINLDQVNELDGNVILADDADLDRTDESDWNFVLVDDADLGQMDEPDLNLFLADDANLDQTDEADLNFSIADDANPDQTAQSDWSLLDASDIGCDVAYVEDTQEFSKVRREASCLALPVGQARKKKQPSNEDDPQKDLSNINQPFVTLAEFPQDWEKCPKSVFGKSVIPVCVDPFFIPRQRQGWKYLKRVIHGTLIHDLYLMLRT